MATKNTRATASPRTEKVAEATSPSKEEAVEIREEAKAPVKEEVKPDRKPSAEIADNETIEVEAIASNVYYKDPVTNNPYEWRHTGDIQEMTFEEVKNMWRFHRGYFEGMALKPLDERVPAKLRFGKDYAKFDELSDDDSYTKANIDKTLELISFAPDNVKINTIIKVKGMVKDEKLSDVGVLKKLEDGLKIDLMSLI